MSTKELAYSIIDGLSEDELSAFVLLFKDRAGASRSDTRDISLSEAVTLPRGGVAPAGDNAV